MLKYNADLDTYSLDTIKDTTYEKGAGNLIGVGNIPKLGTKEQNELNLAFEYNEFFSGFYKRFPNAAWIYYTSENNFRNIYPWSLSSTFTNTKDNKSSEFYRSVNAENNPSRVIKWSPAYLDHGGKGIVVTLSSPIYDDNTFRGAVSLDLTNKKLSDLMNSKYDSYLVDAEGSIIATNKNILSSDKPENLNALLKLSAEDSRKLMEVKNNQFEVIGGYYIYKVNVANAPWGLYSVVPMYSLLSKCIFYSLPVLGICTILIFLLREVERRIKLERTLHEVAITDQLTGLGNRYHFDEKVFEEMERADRYKRHLTMIIFDLDHFKTINDTYGHPIGDEVLKQTSEIAKGIIRSTDMLFRFGGEEFIILMPETDISGAEVVAEKIRSALESNMHPVGVSVTASFGAAERSHNESFTNWYKRADKALYSAKSQGRNKLVCATEEKDI
ncbi:MAG: diguanylate cyclase [Solirubrobacterales bacterium]